MNPQDTEAALRKALELDPYDCGARIELGALYEDQDEFVEAAAEFERVIAIDPKHGGSYCQLGRIYRKQGLWSAAEAALRKAQELDPQNSWARIELGTLYQGQDRFPEAAAEFERAATLDGNQGFVYCQLGRIYRKQGRVAEAEAALKQALEFGPENGGVRFELGALYQDQGRFSEAAAEFERAIAKDGKNGWAHCQLGRIYRRLERWPEAEAALKKALELDPRNEGACLELGALYQSQDRFPEAAGECERAIAIAANDGRVHCQLGAIYRRLGRSSDAETSLRRALDLDPRNVVSRMELGSLYKDLGKSVEAAAEFERAIAIDPNHSGAHRELGMIHRRQGRSSEAEAALKKALELDPQNVRARMQIGSLYEDQGRLTEAEAEFEKASAIDPNNVGVHLCLGHVHLRLGGWAKAAAEFQRAAALDPRSDGAQVGLWAAFRGQGRPAEAEAALARAFAISPRSAFACTELVCRLDRDRSVSDGAQEPTRERVFCLLPWTDLHVRTDGSLHPCASWSGLPLGNARSSSLAELGNSPGMKALRADMMNGRPTAGCWRCYEDERAGFLSMRQKKNNDLSRHRGRERLTAPDGALPRLPVLLLDFRFSNVCNLRCRTCDAVLSSAWAADAEALGLPCEGGPIQRPYADWDTLWRQLQPLLEEGIEEIHFVGGEPLFMEEHYRVLDFLIARGLTDVRLSYNMNFSTLRFQGRDVIDLWSRFRDVSVAASLDGSGRRGEYLRKGLSWDAVIANREEMLRRCPDVALSIFATISVFNALHLPDFHREWVEKGYIDRDAFRLNTLLNPAMYRVQVLPAALKQRISESYRRHRESFLDAGGLAERDFAAAAHYLLAEDYSELLPVFVAMTRRLDELRGEDCREVFPELAELFEVAA